MNIMVSGIVACDVLEGVPWKGISAVIVDGLDCRAGEEAHSLARGHEGEFVGDAGAEGVEEEALKGVIIESAEGIGDIEAVVPGVECGCLCLVPFRNNFDVSTYCKATYSCASPGEGNTARYPQ